MKRYHSQKKKKTTKGNENETGRKPVQRSVRTGMHEVLVRTLISCVVLVVVIHCFLCRCMRETCWTSRSTGWENTATRTAPSTAGSGTGGNDKASGSLFLWTEPSTKVRAHKSWGQQETKTFVFILLLIIIMLAIRQRGSMSFMKNFDHFLKEEIPGNKGNYAQGLPTFYVLLPFVLHLRYSMYCLCSLLHLNMCSLRSILKS